MRLVQPSQNVEEAEHHQNSDGMLPGGVQQSFKGIGGLMKARIWLPLALTKSVFLHCVTSLPPRSATLNLSSMRALSAVSSSILKTLKLMFRHMRSAGGEVKSS